MTKVVEYGFDYADFVSQLVEKINGRAFVTIDFHGFAESGEELRFVFASRNTSLVSNSSRNGFIVKNMDNKNELINFFTKRSEEELRNDWISTHAEICKFGDSTLNPLTLCCMTVIMQPFEHGLEKDYETSS